MPDKQYTVKHGDTLWDIAGKHLGNSMKWPEIHDYNNKPAIISKTGVKITNPDLIFVGQKIYIPDTKSPVKPTVANRPKMPSAKPPPNAGKTKAKKKVRSIPFKYELNKLPSIVIASPTHIATITLKGSVTLQNKNSIEFATLTKQGFEVTAKREADHAFGKLISENQVGFNPSTKEITFECGITSHSNIPNTLKTKVAAGISSKTGLPILKGSIIAPDIKGNIDNFFYITNSLNVEVEITPRPPTAKPRPEPIPSARPVPSRSPGWDYLLGGALVVGAGIIIVGTIVEDILTAGLGIADDAPSFAAAAAMFTSGTLLFKSVNNGAAIHVEGHGIEPDQL
jgi:LysM repeat protein